MAECKHGFEGALCDICFPRVTAVLEPATPAQTRARRAATATATRLRNAGTPKPLDGPTVPLANRRIYHVTHLRNLESILYEGAIKAGATPEVDLLTPEERERRSTSEVIPGASVTEFVPFSLSPDAAWWEEIRRGAADTRWSSIARSSALTQYVILVGTAGAIGPEVVVSDGDATAPLTRFAVGVSAGGSLLRSATIIDPDLLQPEVLARGQYPMRELALIGLPNEPIRYQVKEMIREIGEAAPKLAVYPPWFQPTPEEL